MTSPLDKLSGQSRDKLKQTKQPGWTDPMLAKLTHDPFSDDGWVYERKLDGERCLVFRDGEDVKIKSRNKKNLNDTYPELVDAAAKLKPQRFIVDGEIVAFEGNVTSFSRLQRRLGITDPDKARATGVKVHLYLFDVLHVDGHDTTALPQRDRKRVLRAFDGMDDPIRFTPHRNGDGLDYLQDACRKHWEGLIAKRADAPYHHGRSSDWLKFKCDHRQEFVITGFTDPKGSRAGFGALVLGYYDDGKLRHAGKVGTGFNDKLLRSLRQKMDKLEQDDPPFDRKPSGSHKDTHWLKPRLVGEVAFTEWTSDGQLRHPRFIGLRDDKNPKDVVRERPAD